MSSNPSALDRAASEFSLLLDRQAIRIVFAESCTAGLVSATLAKVPGISKWHCGSMVTYRNQTKIDWLDVSPETISLVTEVSEQVAGQMATGVLSKTQEAEFSAAVTGHLGPDAPAGFDGLVFMAAARRSPTGVVSLAQRQLNLTSEGRLDRQIETATELLSWLRQVIAAGAG